MEWTRWVFLSCIFAGLGVMAGAFGAHLLRGRLSPQDLGIFETAVRYQLFHALALLGVALVASHIESTAVKLAGYCFVVGMLLFSGSLYGLVGTGLRWLGAITPLGGLSFLAGWCALAYSVLGR